jgi:PEGA domain
MRYFWLAMQFHAVFAQPLSRWSLLARNAVLLMAVIFLAVPGGCVRRRLTVRTTPPGAVVSVDNQSIGTTPAASSFTYYGTREVRIEKDGFRTETIKRRINPPWYEAPGLDFISETLWPWEIRDERIIDVQLVPETIEPTEVVLQRADQLRSQSRAGLVTSPKSVQSQ